MKQARLNAEATLAGKLFMRLIKYHLVIVWGKYIDNLLGRFERFIELIRRFYLV